MCRLKTLSVCRFKTSPFFAGNTRTHVSTYVPVLPAYTGDVLNLHTESVFESTTRGFQRATPTSTHTDTHSNTRRQRQKKDKKTREKEKEKEKEKRRRKEKRKEDMKEKIIKN